jgi:DNA-directed RNA polymerase specialized sigma24 family protein
MRLTVRTCYDFLRGHQRNRETSFTDISDTETDWLERFETDPQGADEKAAAAKELIRRVLEQLSPSRN